MLDPVMFVIATPAVAVNHAFGIHFPAYNTLECLFAGIWYDLSIHLPLALKDTKPNRLTRSSPATLAGYSSGTEVGFIHFDCASNQSLLLAPLGNPPT